MSVYNFCAGPATLPPAVMQKAQQEFLDWQGLGVSVMEISHRSEPFLALAKQSEERLRRLMNIPEEYAVLFMHGGGRGQFSAVPLNLHQEDAPAVYCHSGIWSQGAFDEAIKFTNAVSIDIRNDSDSEFSVIPVSEWELPQTASYIHYCPNETIDGIELFDAPTHPTAPIIADMSSNILSREINVSDFDLIYAGAQKNIGPSGLCIVIVKKILIEREGLPRPGILDYALEVKQGSMFNTPPTFAWYLANEVFAWIEEQGGVKAVETLNKKKAKLLYDFIDSSDFYSNKVSKAARSLMNVPFWLNDESLNPLFLAQATDSGLLALEGHRSVGGMRASIYNAMPYEGVVALVEFMARFEQEHS